MKRFFLSALIVALTAVLWSVNPQPAAAVAESQVGQPLQIVQFLETAQFSRSGRSGPQTLVAPGGSLEKDCEAGDTTETCCAGINFCGCLHDPLGSGPTACFCSPPAGQSC